MVTLLVVALVLVPVACVDRTGGQKLAASGSSTANTLASYYDSLSQQLDEISEMEALSNAVRGIPRDTRYEKLIQDTHNALQRRSQLARQLSASYESLNNLSSYNASAEVSAAFGKLTQSVSGLPPMKGLNTAAALAPVDPQKALSAAAGWLAAWKQSRDIEKAVEGLTQTLAALADLYAQELPACQSISEEHVEKASVIAEQLIKKGQVNAWPLVEADVESIGLRLANPNQPPSDPVLADGLAAVVRAHEVRLQTLADSAGQSLLDGLNRQLAAQRRFQASEAFTVADIQTAINDASSFLDEISKQRKPGK